MTPELAQRITHWGDHPSQAIHPDHWTILDALRPTVAHYLRQHDIKRIVVAESLAETMLIFPDVSLEYATQDFSRLHQSGKMYVHFNGPPYAVLADAKATGRVYLLRAVAVGEYMWTNPARLQVTIGKWWDCTRARVQVISRNGCSIVLQLPDGLRITRDAEGLALFRQIWLEPGRDASPEVAETVWSLLLDSVKMYIRLTGSEPGHITLMKHQAELLHARYSDVTEHPLSFNDWVAEGVIAGIRFTAGTEFSLEGDNGKANSGCADSTHADLTGGGVAGSGEADADDGGASSTGRTGNAVAADTVPLGDDTWKAEEHF